MCRKLCIYIYIYIYIYIRIYIYICVERKVFTIIVRCIPIIVTIIDTVLAYICASP